MTATITRRVGASAAAVTGVLAVFVFVPAAGAASGWSRSPGSALPGTAIRVASSATALCQWLQPADPTPVPADTPSGDGVPGDPANPAGSGPSLAADAEPTGDPIAYDGTQVELALEGFGISVPIGVVPVTPGGAWSGSVTLPDANEITPGDYELIARCIVDDPALEGIHSFDFDPLMVTVVDAPPPTTVTIPTEIGEALSITKTEVEGAGLQRPAGTANQGAPVATLPNTGDGTVGVALAGFGALALGGCTLWWGNRRNSSGLLDDPLPARE